MSQFKGSNEWNHPFAECAYQNYKGRYMDEFHLTVPHKALHTQMQRLGYHKEVIIEKSPHSHLTRGAVTSPFLDQMSNIHHIIGAVIAHPPLVHLRCTLNACRWSLRNLRKKKKKKKKALCLNKKNKRTNWKVDSQFKLTLNTKHVSKSEVK